MNLNLKDKTALVCGATQGLGLATAKELALLGAHVVLLARNKQSLETAKQSLDVSLGQKHDLLVADFTDTSQVKSTIDGYLNCGRSIHILVNNTGGPAGGDVLSADSEQFINAFQLHLVNNHTLVQAVVPGMKAAGFGRIVNIISTSVKMPIAGLGVSNTIRAAVANWAKTLAGELGPFGITVNNALPGFHETARLQEVLNSRASKNQIDRASLDQQIMAEIPARRYGKAEEFGAAVAFLCSPAASYITGINLPVDGGRLGCL